MSGASSGSRGADRSARAGRWARGPGRDAAWSAGLVLLVGLPLLLGRGFWLVGDMVFVPQQPWKSAWLGLDGALPRAVPMDALISVATSVLPGEVVQRLLLLGGLLLGGIGIGRLLAEHRWYARAAAITLLLWNPWVYERLLIGQWAILLGYLALPWVAIAARRIRADPRDWGPAGVALVAAAVCSPSSGLTAAGVLLLLGATRRTWWRIVLIGTVANLTWLVPSLVAARATITADGVFEGFAARAESGAGVVASVLSLGGIWKSSILPAERTGAALVLLSCLLSVAALAGLRRALRDRPGETARYAALAGASVALALLPTTAAGVWLLEAVAGRVPAVAILRDSHRYLAPLALPLAIGAAGLVTRLREAVRPGLGALWSAIVLVVVAPVLLLPSLAWGAAGELRLSVYPGEWDRVAAEIDAADGSGATVVLPWTGSYRGFDFNHRRAVLDPAPRYLPGEVVIDDRVLLGGTTVPGEDPRAAEIGAALAAADPAAALRDLGVRWVLVERGMGAAEPPQGRVAVAGEELLLVDLGPAASRGGASDQEVFLICVGHAMALVLLITAGVCILPTRE
ncbi:hypothetical protein [Nocardioides sp. YIM 152588]|uniref:hypothetical protein n=1 Tax=Nocardioides sp. YIM 152588 TaxID=3158259 RepID=UPI0032E36ADF